MGKFYQLMSKSLQLVRMGLIKAWVLFVPALTGFYALLAAAAKKYLTTPARKGVFGGTVVILLFLILSLLRGGGGSQFVGLWESAAVLPSSARVSGIEVPNFSPGAFDLTCEIRHNSGKLYYVKVDSPSLRNLGDLVGDFVRMFQPPDGGPGLIAAYEGGSLKIDGRIVATLDARTGHLIMEGREFRKVR